MSVLKVVTIVPLIAAREGIKLGHLLWRVYIPTWPNWRHGPAQGATVTTDLYRTCRPTPASGAQGRNMSQEDKLCYSLLAFRINDSVQESISVQNAANTIILSYDKCHRHFDIDAIVKRLYSN